MSIPHPTGSTPARALGQWDAVSLILGIVIGTSIFRSPSDIFSFTNGIHSALLLWVAGGALSIIGALCFAELASAWPERGGDAVYLSQAFGNWMGYLLGWCRVTVIIPANVGIMAFAFQDYMGQAFPALRDHSPWIAVAAVGVLTGVNLVGVQSGRHTQNLLTLAKILGLGFVVVCGLVVALQGPTPEWTAPAKYSNPGLALVFILYAFGGWNDAVYLAAEMDQPQRQLPRALTMGVGAVCIVYLLINLAYSTLGIQMLRAESVPAAAVAQRAFGTTGTQLVTLLMVVSALGAMHGTIFGGTRLAVAMGERHRSLRWLAHWSGRGAPARSTLLIAAGTLWLIAAVETSIGQTTCSQIARWLGASEGIDWQRHHGGFSTLLAATAPLFWMFFMLAGAAQIVLRIREPETPRAFRTPLYPLPPILFILTSAAMLYSSVSYVKWLAMLGFIPVIGGLLAWLYERSDPGPTESSAD
ncbi:MAG: amino acid permease [Planctomycetota bacterium]|nr:MAG: amino acid permease [Planctomycetota bacterium]